MDGLEALRRRYPWPEAMPEVPPDEHGWFSECNARMLSRFLGPQTGLAVELGSWLGASARHILRAAPRAVLVCVDHWQGSREHRLPGAAEASRLPTLYETFLRNLWPWRDRVVPLRAGSLAGLAEVHAAGLQPELIYVDASHEYDDVLADVSEALRLFPRAQLVGDDYSAPWPGVRKTVDDIAARCGLLLQVEGHTWALIR